jgi:hypothetical protein
MPCCKLLSESPQYTYAAETYSDPLTMRYRGFPDFAYEIPLAPKDPPGRQVTAFAVPMEIVKSRSIS